MKESTRKFLSIWTVLVLLLSTVASLFGPAQTIRAKAEEPANDTYSITVHRNISESDSEILTLMNVEPGDEINISDSSILNMRSGEKIDFDEWHRQNQGFDFCYFTPEADGSGEYYFPIRTLTPEGDLDLYVQWKKIATITVHENNGAPDEKVESVQGIFSFWISRTQISAGDDIRDFSFAKGNLVFNHWNTEPDGSGIHYSSGSFGFDFLQEDLELYAIWSDPLTLTLHANNGTEDTESLTGANPFYYYSFGTEISLSCIGDNVRFPMFQNSGYVFKEWNTKPDGTGTAKFAQSFMDDLTEDLDLYAIWETPHTLTVHSNNGADETASVTGSNPFRARPNYISSNNEYVNFEFNKPGYTIYGWNTRADGSGTTYHFYEDFELTGDLDLYAVWGPAYTLTVHSNNGADKTAYITGGNPFQISSNYINANGTSVYYQFDNPGFAISGWNTKADGSGTNYRIGVNIELTENLDLYAQWVPAMKLILHENSGAYDKTLTVAGINDFTIYSDWIHDSTYQDYDIDFKKTGYTITSWNTKPDGTGIEYNPGDYITVPSTLDLYAQWSKEVNITLHIPGNGNAEEIRTFSAIQGMDLKFIRSYSNPAQSTICAYNPEIDYVYRNLNIKVSREDIAIVSWNTKPDGTGESYLIGADSHGPVTENMDLYAIVTNDVARVTYIIEDENGGYFLDSDWNEMLEMTCVYPLGSAIFPVYSADSEIAGYSLDLSSETYYDFAQMWAGELKAEKDITLYAVYPKDGTYDDEYNFKCDLDEESGFYYFELNNGTVYVAGYDGRQLDDVRIPESINGKSVSAFMAQLSFMDIYDQSVSPVKSFIYPDYLPHIGGIYYSYFDAEMDAYIFPVFEYPELESIIFEGNIPEVGKYGFEGLDIIGYYPSCWTKIPSEDFGGAKHITWVPMEEEPEDISSGSIGAISSNVYTGKAIEPTVKVTFGGKTLVQGTDYTVRYSNNTDIGTATVIITGRGKYTGTKTATFKIIPPGPAISAVTNCSTYVKVTWDAVPEADGYVVYRSDNGGKFSKIATVDDGSVSYSDKDAKKSLTKYSYQIVAYKTVDGVLYESEKSEAKDTCFIARVSAPTLSNTATGVKVTWKAIDGADGYYVYRSTKDGAYEYVKIKDGTATSYTDTVASKNNTKYTYYVKAYKVVDGTTYKSYKSTAKDIYFMAQMDKPSLSNTSTGVKVSWTKVSGASGYYIYRKTGSGDKEKIKTITSGSTVTYTDTAANTNGTKYTYYVYAYKTVDDTKYKSYTSSGAVKYYVSKLTISSLASSTAKKLTVKWGKNSKATGYQIYYSTSSSFSSYKSVTISDPATVSKTISSLTSGKTYYVKVRAYKTVSSTKYYSPWSSVKSVKVK